MIHGFGHHAKGMTVGCCSGGSDTDLIDNYAVDPITGSTGMRVQFVQVRAINPDKELYPCAMG